VCSGCKIVPKLAEILRLSTDSRTLAILCELKHLLLAPSPLVPKYTSYNVISPRFVGLC
jgi:hypothetical protein